MKKLSAADIDVLLVCISLYCESDVAKKLRLMLIEHFMDCDSVEVKRQTPVKPIRRSQVSVHASYN